MCGRGSYQIIPIAGIFILGETRGPSLARSTFIVGGTAEAGCGVLWMARGVEVDLGVELSSSFKSWKNNKKIKYHLC